MRIACVGGGPAGLYFAGLMKLRDPGNEVTVYERNPSGITDGWGVVFWEDLLAALQDSDAPVARELAEQAFRWDDQVVDVQGAAPVGLGGTGFSLSRTRLLDILARRAQALGVDVRFEHPVTDQDELAGADLVVACDGVSSRLRRRHAAAFGTSVAVGRNKYIWLGTSKVFEAFTFAFVETAAGWVWFHAYGYDRAGSTCIVECSPETWAGLGLDRAGDAGLAILERIFARQLDGHRLRSQPRDDGRAPWLSFRTVSNARWHHGNLVLAGDAAHTTHFAIGSGTTLALQDAVELAAALDRHADLQQALAAYTAARQRALLLPQREALHSARWFERVPRSLELGVPAFATLLWQRRSALLARLGPRPYYRLHQASQPVAPLRELWERAAAWRRARWVRRQAARSAGPR